MYMIYLFFFCFCMIEQADKEGSKLADEQFNTEVSVLTR